MSITRKNITLGEKVRLINHLIEHSSRLKSLSLQQLSDRMESELSIKIAPAALGCTYRPEANYPPLRGEGSPAKSRLHEKIDELEKRVDVMEAAHKARTSELERKVNALIASRELSKLP